MERAKDALQEVDPKFKKSLNQFQKRWREGKRGKRLGLDPVLSIVVSARERKRTVGNAVAEIRDELVLRWEELDRAQKAYLEVTATLDSVGDKWDRQSAGYSQSSILAFIANSRYELNPHNLASAMAGLPYIGGRQSYERCETNLLGSTTHIHFRIWKLLQCVCEGLTSNVSVLEGIKVAITTLKKKDADLKKFLSDNWHYVEEATKKAVRSRDDDRPLSYKITEQLTSCLDRPRTSAEVLLAQMGGLIL